MTKIQWTNETWNPVTGCTKVSQGCKHCYAEREFPRVYAKTGRKFTDIALHPERLEKPLRWTKPRMIFVNSMSDLFHEDVPDEFIDQVFGIMSACDRHTFQVLTKRPERMRTWFATRTPDISFGAPLKAGDPIGADPEEVTRWKIAGAAGEKRDNCGLDWPLRNVWLGVSVEDQATADERIPLLLETPAALRWVSYEPALGPVEFRPVLTHCPTHDFASGFCIGPCPDRVGIDWIVVGGESGPGARPFDIGWARSTVEQCKEAGVSVFVKQVGARPFEEGCEVGHVWIGRNPSSLTRVNDRKGGDMEEWPADLRVREWPEVRS